MGRLDGWVVFRHSLLPFPLLMVETPICRNAFEGHGLGLFTDIVSLDLCLSSQSGLGVWLRQDRSRPPSPC